MRVRDFLLSANENLHFQLKIGGKWFYEEWWRAAYEDVRKYEQETHCRLFVASFTISDDEPRTLVVVCVEE